MSDDVLKAEQAETQAARLAVVAQAGAQAAAKRCEEIFEKIKAYQAREPIVHINQAAVPVEVPGVPPEVVADIAALRGAIADMAAIAKHIELLNLFTRAQYAADKNVSGYRWENPDRDFAWDTGNGVATPMDAHDFTEWAYVELARLRG